VCAMSWCLGCVYSTFVFTFRGGDSDLFAAAEEVGHWGCIIWGMYIRAMYHIPVYHATIFI